MLNAEVAGTGKVLVFLHGYGENLSLWHKISTAFGTNYKVILIDLPGFGKSKPFDSSFSIEDVAKSIEHHLSTTHQIDKFTVFGHSLGGYVGLALKELFPEKVLGLGLINSTAYADSVEKKQVRDKAKKFIIKNGTNHFLKSFVPNLFTIQNQIKMKSAVQEVYEMGENLPTSVLTSYLAAMSNRKDRSHILANSSNILFIGGLDDKLISLYAIKSQISMLKTGVNGHILDDVAHMSMIESPGSLETHISTFLQMIESD